MSKLISKTVQDVVVAAYVETSRLWICLEDVCKLLHISPSSLNIPIQHRQYCYDFKNTCRIDNNNKVFVDLVGLAIICLRCSSPLAEYLLTQFVGEVYTEFCCQTNNHGTVAPYHCRPNEPPNDLLECVLRQLDLILNSIAQLCANNNTQFTELNNQVSAIRLQNTNITAQLNSILELLNSQIVPQLTSLADQIDGALAQILNLINSSTESLSEQIRNDTTATNAILANLTSGVNNMNSTLTNLTQTITTNLDSIANQLEQILAILTPTP
jgi:hypothetical protein